MKNLKRAKAATVSLDLGETPDSTPTVTITHAYGDIVASNLITTGTGTSYTLSLTATHLASAGTHKLVWSYKVSAVNKTQTTYVNVYSQYITSSEFFTRHPELENSKAAMSLIIDDHRASNLLLRILQIDFVKPIQNKVADKNF